MGMIRLDFAGYSGEGKLAEIAWDEWFEKLDENGLALPTGSDPAPRAQQLLISGQPGCRPGFRAPAGLRLRGIAVRAGRRTRKPTKVQEGIADQDYEEGEDLGVDIEESRA
jgi:hypothetical protein